MFFLLIIGEIGMEFLEDFLCVAYLSPRKDYPVFSKPFCIELLFGAFLLVEIYLFKP